jgi:hypothetical protein
LPLPSHKVNKLGRHIGDWFLLSDSEEWFRKRRRMGSYWILSRNREHLIIWCLITFTPGEGKINVWATGFISNEEINRVTHRGVLSLFFFFISVECFFFFLALNIVAVKFVGALFRNTLAELSAGLFFLFLLGRYYGINLFCCCCCCRFSCAGYPTQSFVCAKKMLYHWTTSPSLV